MIPTPLPGERRWIPLGELSPRLRAQVEDDPEDPFPPDARALVRGETVLLIDRPNTPVAEGTTPEGSS